MDHSTTPVVPDAQRLGRPLGGWRLKLYTVVFEADTPAGHAFDLVVIGLIGTSVVVVILDSVQGMHERWGSVFDTLEWAFTLLFTAEYVARLSCVQHPLRYARSFFGGIDLLAILPTYLWLLAPGWHALIDMRVLRLFRILKLAEYVEEYGALGQALVASRRKILVFLSFVLMVVVVMGTLMYVVEGPANGFNSIPVGIYWAVTTMTTVGFGDITPKTDLGRFIASAMMLLGWGTLAVPTGIVTAELTTQRMRPMRLTTRTCPACLSEGHDPEACFCQDCGARLPRYFNSTQS